MAIRIARNDAGNCINFFGSSNPTYWNAVLEGEINEDNPNNINVVNTVRSLENEGTVYEFFNLPFSDFVDKDENVFENASECAQYITDNANVSGTSGTFIFNQTDTLDAQREATNTTVLFSNGDMFSVNSLVASAASNGTITLRTIKGNKDVYLNLRYYNTSVNDGTISFNNIDAAVDRLNEVLSGQAVGSDSGSSDSSIATESNDGNFTVYGDRITNVGDVYTSTRETGNFDTSNGMISNETISEPGEYFEFTQNSNWDSAGTGFTFGLFDETTYDQSDLEEDVAGNVVKNILRLRIKNTNFIFTDPASTYGKINEIGFSDLLSTKLTYRIGLDSQGRAFIGYVDSNSNVIVVGRTETAIATGTLLKLNVIMPLANELDGIGAFTVNTLDTAPPLTWYYIESPDGSFYYPLFDSAEQANYVDEEYGTASNDAGVSHQHTFIDEQPTSNVWYMPSSYMFHDQSSAPSALAGVVWNEIATGDDANYVPTQYADNTVTVNEGSSMNLPIKPAGDADTYNVTGIPTGLAFNGSNLVGTAPEVLQDNTVNPSDTYTITVTKANDYGSSVGTLTLVITNTTVPSVAISGFTLISGSSPLVDTNTLDDGSAVVLDNTVQDNYRVKITDAYVTANILPALVGVDDKYFIGFAPDTVNGWDSVAGPDFICGFKFQYYSATSVNVTPLLTGSAVGTTTTHTFNPGIGYDFYLSNKDGVCEANYNTSTADKSSENAVADGGTFTFTASQDTTVTGTKSIVIAITGTTGDISTTGISEHQLPAVSSTPLTSWTKAVDFTGGAQHIKSNNNSRSVLPLKMNDQSVLVPAHTTDSTKTSNNSNSRPWATAIVFNIDNNTNNQHIWNQGEGASSNNNNDNIYLRISNKKLYFGWGREGVGYNECMIHPTPSAPSGFLGHNAWYGVYIAHKGTRLSGTNATASNLADAFDIRLMNSAGNNWTIGSNLSVSAAWTSTGVRMDRSITGDLCIGGRYGNRNFNGEVASMVITTLRTDDNLPTNAEITAMVKDPMKWIVDYKEGNNFRHCTTDYSNYSWDTNGSKHFTTQVYLMGDGTNDSFSSGIMNQVNNTDGYTKMIFQGMTSSDIENATISGLS